MDFHARNIKSKVNRTLVMGTSYLASPSPRRSWHQQVDAAISMIYSTFDETVLQAPSHHVSNFVPPPPRPPCQKYDHIFEVINY